MPEQTIDRLFGKYEDMRRKVEDLTPGHYSAFVAGAGMMLAYLKQLHTEGADATEANRTIDETIAEWERIEAAS